MNVKVLASADPTGATPRVGIPNLPGWPRRDQAVVDRVPHPAARNGIASAVSGTRSGAPVWDAPAHWRA